MPRITPGTYLRMRREAAGLSIEDVAMLIPGGDAQTTGTTRAAIVVLAAIEADEVPVTVNWLHALRVAFPFDIFICRQLAAGIAAPELCAVCACSWADPCDDEVLGPCAWATRALCTHCAARAAAIATVHA